MSRFAHCKKVLLAALVLVSFSVAAERPAAVELVVTPVAGPPLPGRLVALDANEVNISANGAEQLWRLPYSDRGASAVIHDSFVYVVGGWQKPHAVCAGLESGKIAWQTRVPATEISSPVVADGKIWYVFGMSGRTSLYCLRATPKRYVLLGKAAIPAVTATSPAIADGRIYLRLPNAVACYDLRR